MPQRSLSAHGSTLLICLAMLFVNASSAPAQPPLIWGSDAEGGAPYIFKDPSDPKRNIGFEVDLAEALARELGRPIEFKQYAFPSLILGVERQDFDFAMSGLEITPDRLKRVRFSRPYYAYKLQLVVRENEERFSSLAGCKQVNGVVGTLEDTAASRLLDELGVRKRIYEGQVEPYQDLLQGQVDAVLLDLPIALYYARQSMVNAQAPKLKFVGNLIGRGYYAIAFNLKDESLAQEVDGALERLQASGELRRIYKKWNIWNDSQEEFLPLGIFREYDEKTDPHLIGKAQGFFLLLVEGAGMTVLITVCSFLLAVVIAMPLALARLYGCFVLRSLATVYVEFFRGIPVLLLLVFLYYGLPAISDYYQLGFTLKLNAFAAAVLGFGFNYAAYEAEIYRAGISEVPLGQWEAGGSLGMSSPLTFRRIILPQAIKVILPPTTNDLVALFKDTSIVSIIALVELSKQYQILAKSTGNYLEIGLATAALYLVMSVPLAYLARTLEQRWKKAGNA